MRHEPALSEIELAVRWGMSIKTLQRWRYMNQGPRFFKFGRVVRYAIEDVLAYEEAQRRGPAPSTDRPPLPVPSASSPASETSSSAPEPKRYSLREAMTLVAQYGSLKAAEAAMSVRQDPTPE